jgi:chromate reductase, NAD(P)H dehydrogenase (quinone)
MTTQAQSPQAPILIISGTNRPGSNAMKVARVIESHYRAANTETNLFSLVDLPAEIFSPSGYATKPPAMVAIQQRILAAAGLHIVIPEYNGSFPGVLKYFIDMLKFPESFERKPVAFVGESAGIFGALRAVEQLQTIFCYRNAYLLPDRVFIPGIHQKFDPDDTLNDPAINQRLANQAIEFPKFIQRIGSIMAI